MKSCEPWEPGSGSCEPLCHWGTEERRLVALQWGCLDAAPLCWPNTSSHIFVLLFPLFLLLQWKSIPQMSLTCNKVFVKLLTPEKRWILSSVTLPILYLSVGKFSAGSIHCHSWILLQSAHLVAPTYTLNLREFRVTHQESVLFWISTMSELLHK